MQVVPLRWAKLTTPYYEMLKWNLNLDIRVGRNPYPAVFRSQYVRGLRLYNEGSSTPEKGLSISLFLTIFYNQTL